MPEIQRCSPCTQIGISSSESFDSDSSLISPVDCDGNEIDAIDPNDELDEDVDKVHLMIFSPLWLRYCECRSIRSSLITVNAPPNGNMKWKCDKIENISWALD